MAMNPLDIHAAQAEIVPDVDFETGNGRKKPLSGGEGVVFIPDASKR